MEAREITNEDLCRVRITCRCGTQSIAEVPEQFARLINVYVCPSCSAGLTSRQVDEYWKIERAT